MAACTGLTGYGQETHLDEVQRMSRHSLGELWESPHYYPPWSPLLACNTHCIHST